MHSLVLVCALLGNGSLATDTAVTEPMRTASTQPEVAPPPPPVDLRPAPRIRRYGVHLGLNLTFTFDLSVGRYFYGGATTALTGLGVIGNPNGNYTLSLLAFAGVGIPLVERDSLRFTFDVTPELRYVHASPVNLLGVGLMAGVRLVHRSGFTFAVKLPLAGYAGAPDARRGSLLNYYISSIPTVPIITFGYSF